MKPISERFRIIADEWADQDCAAFILDEMKTATLAKMKVDLIEANPGMADNAADRIARASEAWAQYIRDMAEARRKANRLKGQMKELEMRHREWIGRDATARAEMRL